MADIAMAGIAMLGIGARGTGGTGVGASSSSKSAGNAPVRWPIRPAPMRSPASSGNARR